MGTAALMGVEEGAQGGKVTRKWGIIESREPSGIVSRFDPCIVQRDTKVLRI